MNKNPVLRILTLVVALALGLGSGCATTGSEVKTGKSAKKTARVTAITGRVSLEQGPETLGNTARAIGAQHSGGIVVMHGLGFESVPALAWKDRKFEEALHELAGHAGSALTTTPDYGFLHPQGYEVLNSWNFVGLLPPALAETPVEVAFGNGTKLSSAAAFLGHVSGVSVIVDNAVADARTGEIWLPSLPLATVLDALMKSARVTPESVVVETGERLVFIKSRSNRSTPVLTGASSDALKERVTVYLPAAPKEEGHFEYFFNALPIGELAPRLSRQMGIPVTLSPEFEVLPVEQTVFIDQPREVVLKYLIAQWPAPGIGYRWDGTGVVLERHTP